MLNHASFGVMTTEIMDLATSVRAELEEDSLALVDVLALLPRLQHASETCAHVLGLEPGSFALTQNATAGAAALMRSLPLREGDQVVVMSTEYASILRGWQVRCEETGASFLPLAVELPVRSVEQLIGSLEAKVRGAVKIAQLSLVSSSTAVAFPVEALTRWFRSRGAAVAIDAAHGPGHVELDPVRWGASAMFGTLHKWFPTPRPVGFIWLATELRDAVRPAEVSLTWDASDLVERFAWPGTYDPTPRLCVGAAMERWVAWRAAGDLDRCAGLAGYASSRLGEVGGVPTSCESMRPPRMRAVVLECPHPERVRAAMDDAEIRAWTGAGPGGETMLRVATHVYNDESDVDRLCDVVTSLR